MILDARSIRWRTGLVLLVLTPIAVIAAWFVAGLLANRDRSVQMTAAIASLVIMLAIQAAWWTFFARLGIRRWLLGLCGMGILAGAAGSTVRIDGFQGEMLPNFAFRWTPTAEERALSYFRGVEPSASAADGEQAVTISEGDWPQFRGPGRDAVVPDVEIATDWKAHPPEIVWTHPCGLGWSSFAVADARLFTQEQRGDEEVVVCYAAKTGKPIWVHHDEARFKEKLGGDGPRATPTIADGRVYALGATGLLNCLEAVSGAVVWQRDILADAGNGKPIKNITWGMAGSPLVWQDLVFVVPGGAEGREVIAYNAETGEIVWAAGKTAASYAAPRIETIGGRPHLLVFDAEGLKGFAPKTGELLWSYGPFKNQFGINAAQPIVQGDKIMISSGYGVGSALLQVTEAEGHWQVEELWRHKNDFKLKFNDAVLFEGNVYGPDSGILACFNFATGERQWKRGRYGFGQVLLLGEALLVLSEQGALVAVRPTSEKFVELARFPVLKGKTWNHPAYSDGYLYVRNDRKMACVKLPVLAGSDAQGEEE